MLLHIFNDEFESNTEASITNIHNTSKEPVRQNVLSPPPLKKIIIKTFRPIFSMPSPRSPLNNSSTKLLKKNPMKFYHSHISKCTMT